MDDLAWVAILRQIPADKLNGFTIVLEGNIEITLQSLPRLDVEFAVFKGRLSGSQDAGRVFFVPYRRIVNLGTLHPIKDEDYDAIFQTLTIPSSAVVVADPVPTTPPVPATEGVAANGQNPPKGQNGASQNDSGVRASMRSEVLDRFRSRPNAPSSSANLPNPRHA